MSDFQYETQTRDGAMMNGTIAADDYDSAMRILAGMGLRVTRLTVTQPVSQVRPLGEGDFAAFNEQLAQLTAAGLPVESGLKLVGAEVRSGRLKAAIDAVAEQLRQGKSLGDAVSTQRAAFPVLYGTLIDAGVASGNLSGVLMNLGRHLELSARFRQQLWHASAYPLMVILSVSLLLLYIGNFVLPAMLELNHAMIHSFGLNPQHRMGPWLTKVVSLSVPVLSPVLIAVVITILMAPLFGWTISRLGWSGRLIDRVGIRLPLLGPIFSKLLIARWLDAVRLGLGAGLDLPAAMQLAHHGLGSPRLKRDSARLVAQLQAGQTLSQVGTPEILPGSVLAAMDVATGAGSLPQTVAALAESYRTQTELRISLLPSILTPVLLAISAVLVGIAVLALIQPLGQMLRLLQGLT